MSDASLDVSSLDTLSSFGAGALLEQLCGSGVWVVAMVALRPHGSLELLCTRSDEAITAMEWSDVLQALAIGAVRGRDDDEGALLQRVEDDGDDVDREAVCTELAAVVRGRLQEALY